MDLRETFDSDAELYDRVRPGYPEALYDDLQAITGLGEGAQALEIGPGTGQATVPMARRGFRVTGIELGANLAAVARRNLDTFEGCEVRVGRFEDLNAREGGSDLIYSATAFHWLNPATRVADCVRLLRPGGWLVVWSSWHCAGGTGQFFIDTQDCYERWDPATPKGLRLTHPDDLPDDPDGTTGGDGFEPAIHRRYLWEQTYTTEGYLDLLLTYSGHIAMEDRAREGLLACIRDLIDSRYGGEIRKAYLTRMTLARRSG
jgi:SAM-dependent methyltransferase